MGLLVVILHFVLFGSGFVYFGDTLPSGLLRLVGSTVSWGMVGGGCPGHGPTHLLSDSAAEVGFQWDPHALAWIRPGLPLLCNLAGPIQHFRAAILRKGFRGGPLFDIHGSLQLLNSSHVREREIRPCFVPFLLGVFGMVFFLVGFVALSFLWGS